jgi:hypothetical protein
MKKFNLLLICSVFVLLAFKQNKKMVSEVTLTKLWETDTLLKTSESVKYHPEKDVIYVSNIGGVPPGKKDGDGSISIINKEGRIINKSWVTGIDAPKGLGFYKDKVFVPNIDEVIRIDINTGAIEKKYPVKEAVFLNDLDVDTNGDVYFTDSNGDKIFKLVNDEVSLWLDLKGFNPNGILVEEDRILILSSNKGDFISIDKKTKELTVLATGVRGGDGIVAAKGGYILSAWQGGIFFVDKDSKGSEAVKILDTREQKLYTADISIIPEENILLVPTFYGNSVIAYKINYK